MVPRSPEHSSNKIAGTFVERKKDVLRVRLHVGALNVQARSADRALKLQTCNATSSCV